MDQRGQRERCRKAEPREGKDDQGRRPIPEVPSAKNGEDAGQYCEPAKRRRQKPHGDHGCAAEPIETCCVHPGSAERERRDPQEALQHLMVHSHQHCGVGRSRDEQDQAVYQKPVAQQPAAGIGARQDRHGHREVGGEQPGKRIAQHEESAQRSESIGRPATMWRTRQMPRARAGVRLSGEDHQPEQGQQDQRDHQSVGTCLLAEGNLQRSKREQQSRKPGRGPATKRPGNAEGEQRTDCAGDCRNEAQHGWTSVDTEADHGVLDQEESRNVPVLQRIGEQIRDRARGTEGSEDFIEPVGLRSELIETGGKRDCQHYGHAEDERAHHRGER